MHVCMCVCALMGNGKCFVRIPRYGLQEGCFIVFWVAFGYVWPFYLYNLTPCTPTFKMYTDALCFFSRWYGFVNFKCTGPCFCDCHDRKIASCSSQDL